MKVVGEKVSIELLRPEVMLKVYDKHGRLIRDVRCESKCFVRNFVNTLYSALTHAGVNITLPDGTTVSRSLVYTGSLYYNYSRYTHRMIVYYLYSRAGVGDDSFGILVGTGTTPPTNDDYKLESKVPQGTGDNQLDHSETGVGDVVEDTVNNVAYFELTRNFYNYGAVDITIGEVGLFVYTRLYVYDARRGAVVDFAYKYLVIRDTPSPVTVPSGGTLMVTYRLRAAPPFVGNFIRWLRALMGGYDTAVRREDGSEVSIRGVYSASYTSYHRHTGPALPMSAMAGENDDSYGVIIGSGTTTEAITNYCLASKLGKDVMKYYVVRNLGMEELDDRWRIRISRDFYNISGASQTVSEVGLITRQYYHFRDQGINRTVDNKALVFRRTISSVTVSPETIFRADVLVSVPK